MNDAEFNFFKLWSHDVAWDIAHKEETSFAPIYVKKIQSIILESMSPSKGWKNSKQKLREGCKL
jgi:hypothetical protein